MPNDNLNRYKGRKSLIGKELGGILPVGPSLVAESYGALLHQFTVRNVSFLKRLHQNDTDADLGQDGDSMGQAACMDPDKVAIPGKTRLLRSPVSTGYRRPVF